MDSMPRFTTVTATQLARNGLASEIRWLHPDLHFGDGCVYTNDSAGFQRLARNATRGNPHSQRAYLDWLTRKLTRTMP